MEKLDSRSISGVDSRSNSPQGGQMIIKNPTKLRWFLASDSGST